MRPGDRVRTVNGRVGVVVSAEGAWVEVVFPEGSESVHRDDLVPLSEGPPGELLRGLFGDATAYGLRLQAMFLQHAYRYDPRSGLSNARIEPNLHQIFIAHVVTNKLQPRMILADEVGLGKTIEAGLVLKELRAREMVERVLIVTPASLQYQWQSELRSKFNEEFEILTSAAAKYLGQGGVNPFTRRDNVICSLPFAANPKRAEQIVEAPWDLVIFDEAHRVRRWLQSGNKEKTTQAYRLADDLKDLVSGLLLLTATPMQLHPYELYSLIELVEPGLYPTFGQYDRRRADLPRLNDLMRSLKGWHVLSPDEQAGAVEEHGKLLRDILGRISSVADLDDDEVLSTAMDGLVEKHPLVGVMVRNRKAELGGFAGREAFRSLVTLDVDELELYEDIATYLRESYNRAWASKQIAIGFLMVTYQKMLASSSFAIHQSLKRRVVKLRKQVAQHEERSRSLSRQALDEMEDAPELSEVVDELDDLFFDPEGAQAEILELEALISRLGNVQDSKAETLLDALETIFDRDPDEKVVIFTQFKETQTYLKAQLESSGLKVAIFNGSMNIDEKEAAVRDFRHAAQVFVSTEAGGEGRNLQFAHILINYDLPWNPMKVEQRIGRLDRIGQKRTVFIYNLACSATIEERVLDVLDNRIRLFTESVGSLDPILGDVEQSIAQLVMSHADRLDEQFEEYAVDLGRRTREARENERILADFVLDRASLRRDRANELLGQPPLASHKDLHDFASAALDYYGGALKPHIEGGDVITLSPRLGAKMQARGSQARGAFDPQEALALEDLDFFAIGHELIDKIVTLPLREEPAQTTAHRLPQLEGGPYLEVYYQIRSEGPAMIGRVLRHLVGPDCVVRSEEVLALPSVGDGVDVDVPPWVADALAASRDQFNRELAETRDVIQVDYEARQKEEVGRAERIFRYRENRLRLRIGEDRSWIEEKERTGSDRDRKILPARRGKLAKDVERLERLESEYDRQVAEIRRRKAEVTGAVWAVAMAVEQ
jgi:SNF2 family DNA or RNA helicase